MQESKIDFLLRFIDRNEIRKIEDRNKVILKYWNYEKNIGDCLSPIVFKYMLDRKNISIDAKTKKKHFVSCIGSILGCNYDTTVWGSGILNEQMASSIHKKRHFVKYDIRATRGPITEQVLKDNGYKTNGVYGDPAILMPLIYDNSLKKEYDVSLIAHIRNPIESNIHSIDVKTDDYKFFIDEILKSKKIISSSLHGIILAEAYGIPCIFLNQGMDNELLKFKDYYYSTNRKEFVMARTIDEALKAKPMEPVDFDDMRNKLIESFPYDLWDK